MYENKGEIKQRKQIVNAFNRQALFYDDKIVITYTFTDNPEHLKKTKESSLENGKKVTDETASSYTVSSNIFSRFPPREN